MKINNIKINNFYSFQEAELAFDQYSGLVMIEGKNKDTGGSNGSGKSSLIEAVVWGLFGKTIRKSTEEAMINFGSKKNCKVELVINDKVRIIRTRRPTFLEFWVGEDNRTQESVTATQEKIEQHLNTNYKLFLASMVFGQNNTLDFVSATPEEKRTIIKNFLNLEELFDKREAIKAKKSIYSTEIKSIDALIAEYTSMHTKANNKIAEIIAGESKFLIENSVTEEMVSKYSLDDILKAEKKIIDLDASLGSMVRSINRSILELDTKEAHLAQTKANKPILCKHCGVTSKKEVSPKEIKAMEFHIAELTSKVKQDGDTANLLEKQIAEIKASIPIPSSRYKVIADWKELHSKKHHLIQDQELYNDKLQELAEKRKEASRKYEVMRFWEVAFSEQGLVKYIIKNIIDYFNNNCNEYLTHLTSGKYRIKFNEMLEETVYIGGKETKFSSLSGGEVKKVNIAVLLGLQSLLALTDKDLSDIIFFDEIAESLDAESLQGLYILLQNLKKTKTLFIITHNNDLKNLIDTPSIITVTKRNGVSTINKKDKSRRKQNVSS